MPVLVREETIEINIKLEHVSVEVVLADVRPRSISLCRAHVDGLMPAATGVTGGIEDGPSSVQEAGFIGSPPTLVIQSMWWRNLRRPAMTPSPLYHRSTISRWYALV